MSLYRRFGTDGMASLVSTNTADRKPVFADANAAGLLIETMHLAFTRTGAELLAHVVMPDHVHLILVPSQQKSLGEVIRLLKGGFARRYNGPERGSVWQPRYHGKTLRDDKELRAGLEYVHLNPVVAGLVAEPSQYRWSSAFSNEGRQAEA